MKQKARLATLKGGDANDKKCGKKKEIHPFLLLFCATSASSASPPDSRSPPLALPPTPITTLCARISLFVRQSFPLMEITFCNLSILCNIFNLISMRYNLNMIDMICII